jgi:hypothetical protein
MAKHWYAAKDSSGRVWGVGHSAQDALVTVLEQPDYSTDIVLSIEPISLQAAADWIIDDVARIAIDIGIAEDRWAN